MSELATSLDAALAELAVDPIAVLRASGVKGQRRSNCNCPVANWLTSRVGYPVDVNVRGAVAVRSTATRVKLPLSLVLAIREIDAGMYLELCV